MGWKVSKGPVIRKKGFVAVAIGFFQTKGFEQTAVTDITKKVGVSHGTFFNSCETKDGILHDIEEVRANVRFVKA